MQINSIYIPSLSELGGSYVSKQQFVQAVMAHYGRDSHQLKNSEDFDYYIAASDAFRAINSNNFRGDQNAEKWHKDFQTITEAELKDFYENSAENSAGSSSYFQGFKVSTDAIGKYVELMDRIKYSSE